MSVDRQGATGIYQQGAATLLVVIVLVILMAGMALTVSNSGLQEQRMTGNDIRAREVHEAAEAGMEYAKAWANKNPVPLGTHNCVGATPAAEGCPDNLTTITGSTSSESYEYSVTYNKTSTSLKVTTTAWSTSDNSIRAVTESHIKQSPLQIFGKGATTPPPWVLAGCITKAPTGTPDSWILSHDGTVAISGVSNDPSCLPQGHLDVGTWEDIDGDGIQDEDERTGSTSFNTGTFPCSGGVGSGCAWENTFQMPLDEVKTLATEAGNTFTSNIPCGPPDSSKPSYYVVSNTGSINSGDISGSCGSLGLAGVDDATIGAPGRPVVIINTTGCPKYNGGITIYGIVYYEDHDACAANGWGGATLYGSVIWEGDVDKPNANSQFIEVDYEDLGNLDDVFTSGIDYATSIPGTWKDYQ